MKYYLAIIFVAISILGFSQDHEQSTQVIDNIIENIASKIDADIDYTTLYEDLITIYYNPININYCTKEDLSKLIFLNNIQINNLINYRKKYGQFLSVYELKLINGFNNDDVKNIIPFITIKERQQADIKSFKNTFKYGKHQILLRYQQILETQKGYNIPDADKTNSNSYLGSPYKLYARYGFKYSNKVQFGITAEKDAGEEFFRGSQPNGFDFYSGFIQINNIGIVKKIVVGDFLAQFGQGLTLYRGMAFNKSTDVLNIMKSPQGLRKYSSTNELEFFRGVGISLEKNNFQFTSFYSNHNIDGNILKDTSDSYHDYISSVYSVDNHGTLSGLAKKGQINEQAFGGNLNFSKGKVKIGATAIYSKFDLDIIPDAQLYKTYNFSGSDNFNYGINYQVNLNRYYFFGEFAGDENMNFAALTGVNIKVVEQIYLSSIYRNYAKDYVNLYATGFSEASKTQNESGLYIGTVYYPYKSLKFSAYFDNFQFNWLKYRVSSPSNGHDYFLQLDYSPIRDFQFTTYLRQEIKQQDISDVKIGVKKQSDISKLRYRFHLSYRVLGNVSLKNRFEQIIYNDGINPISKGYVIYQDLVYKPQIIPFSFYFRYAVFDTDDYNSRIYAYENDVLYAFSVPAYYGKGSRFYTMIKIKIRKNIDFWLRFSQTYYVDRNVISSGLSEIDGNTKSEIKAQIKMKF